ncbi:MAG: CinA family protein [Candidatus Omnitrophica bacterium]|nr:CinA family protein [Candidatus Omnitrophota bacterium]
MNIEHHIAKRLIKKHKTISVAESCSGGLLAHRLTNIPGSSQYFIGGVLVYANTAKSLLLKVSPTLLKKHGAVSRLIAEKMAIAIRKTLKSDFGISITGIAGPAGGTKDKPVGLTYIAVARQEKVVCEKYHFKGTRLNIKTAAVNSALRMLAKYLE